MNKQKTTQYLTIIGNARQLTPDYKERKQKPTIKQLKALAFYYTQYDLAEYLTQATAEPDTRTNTSNYLKRLNQLETQKKLTLRQTPEKPDYYQVLAQLIITYQS